MKKKEQNYELKGTKTSSRAYTAANITTLISAALRDTFLFEK